MLEGEMMFSKIDLKSGYHHLHIQLRDGWTTTFKAGKALWVVGNAIRIIQFIEHFHATNEPGIKTFYWEVRNSLFWRHPDL